MNKNAGGSFESITRTDRVVNVPLGDGKVPKKDKPGRITIKRLTHELVITIRLPWKQRRRMVSEVTRQRMSDAQRKRHSAKPEAQPEQAPDIANIRATIPNGAVKPFAPPAMINDTDSFGPSTIVDAKVTEAKGYPASLSTGGPRE